LTERETEPETEPEPSRAKPEPAWLAEPRTDRPAVELTPEPPTANGASVGPVLGGFLDGFDAIARIVAGLKHEGGAKATAATIRHRFLFDDREDTLADPVVKGLPLARREPLIHAALLEYATQAEPFNRPHFAGFVKRIRDHEAKGTNGIVKLHQPAAPDDGPEPTPEERAAGRALVRQVMNGATPPALTDQEVAARVAEQKRKLALARGGKP
jgi:hypothetical protein